MRHSFTLFGAGSFCLGIASGWGLAGLLPHSDQLTRSPRGACASWDTSVCAETIRVTDTVRIKIVSPVHTAPTTRYISVSPLDTLAGRGDSIRVAARQAVYTDSTYRAVVSGVGARLDSLTLYAPRSTVILSRHAPRWSLGIAAGVGVTTTGFTPAVTFGVCYSFWP